MALLLKGAPVAKAINERAQEKVKRLTGTGIEPALAILRVGERADDLSYEKGAVKRCEQIGVKVVKKVLPADIDEESFFKELEELNVDNNIHGILMFRPLPGKIDNEKARKMLCPDKDVDGCTDGSLAGIFTNTKSGFAPCTAQAAMEILDYYGIECAGKKAVVIGRSLVVGRPVAMMLMHKNATVTICHTKTNALQQEVKAADFVFACAGVAKMLDGSYIREGQVVIDVGINMLDGKLCGDVDYDSVSEIAEAATPVPGGVGTVTTSVLLKHVLESAAQM